MPVDSDSENSVKSDDVLVSTYPVKPRKTPKPVHRMQPYGRGDSNPTRDAMMANDEALSYIRAIKYSRREVYDAEEQRESMDIASSVRCVKLYIKHPLYIELNLQKNMEFIYLLCYKY